MSTGFATAPASASEPVRIAAYPSEFEAEAVRAFLVSNNDYFPLSEFFSILDDAFLTRTQRY